MFDLERFMKDNSLTQNDLARELGVSQTAISKVKNGNMDIPEAWLKYFNSKYDVIITNYFKNNSSEKTIDETYSTNITEDNKKEILMKSLLNLTESNKILADSVHKAIALNERLLEKIEAVW